jgi:hypothetical protein
MKYRYFHREVTLGYKIFAFKTAFSAKAHGADVPASITFDTF